MRNVSIGIIVPGIKMSSSTFLMNLCMIMSSIYNDIHLVGRGIEDLKLTNVNIHSIAYRESKHTIIVSIKYLLLQIFISLKIITLFSKNNTWIFFLGGEALLLPIFTARLLNKKVVILLAGSIEREGSCRKSSSYVLLSFLKRVGCSLSSKIIVYSKSLISFNNVEDYRNKIFIGHEHYLDFNNFGVTTPLANRSPLIGYFGRLSGEKGVYQFVQALPSILSNNPAIRVIIGGEGNLREDIEASLQEAGLTDKVTLLGWIPHDSLPEYLNLLRLLVLPSYTEGLPNIMLEAMACGTPVLTTPVGAIPDYIMEGKTGYIMDNNSPECIINNVIRVLNSPELEQIAEMGRQLVVENFTFNQVASQWMELLDDAS